MTIITQINVDRFQCEADWNISRFYSIPKLISGYGVEDQYNKVKIHGETCIDDDIYNVELTNSPKFSHEYLRDDNGNIIHKSLLKTIELKQKYHSVHELITLKNVKNFSRVLWHWGNTDLDTDGCYCVGTNISTFGKRTGVSNSRLKYVEIYPFIWQSIKALEKENKFLKIQYKKI